MTHDIIDNRTKKLVDHIRRILPGSQSAKFADDIRFNYDAYQPVDSNPDKHPFFGVIERNNNRMQHLALLTRFLILEENCGPIDIKDVNVMEYIDQYQRPP